MSRVKHFLKTNWISIWLVAALFAVGGFIAYASYTGLVVAKRVVSVSESAGVLFSSNRMEAFVGDQITTKHLTSSSTENYPYYLTVCDFAQTDPYTRFGAEIPYTLTAQLVVLMDGSYLPVTQAALGSAYAGVAQDLGLTTAENTEDDKVYTIQNTSQGGTNVTADEIDLRDGEAHLISGLRLTPAGNGTDKFRVVFDRSELSDNQTYDYYVLVKAEPDDSLTSLNDIACYLYASKVNVLSSAWTGELQELKDGGTLGSYDAYNYVIEGSGRATVKLKWDPTVVEISEIFLHDMGITPQIYTEGAYKGWKHFEMEVDSSQKGRYEMQVFKTAGEANDAIISQKIIFG